MKIDENATVEYAIHYLNNYLKEKNETTIVELYDFVYKTLLQTFPYRSITISKGLKRFTLYNQMTFKISICKNKLNITHNPTWSKEQLMMTVKSIDNINNYDLNISLKELKNKSLNASNENQQNQINNFTNLVQSKNISMEDLKEILNAYNNLPLNIKNKMF